MGRLVGIVALNNPTDLNVVFDTSYQFSIELEWCIAEVTCVMLVFCVPALPKMISEHTVLLASRCTDAWRSGTRLGRGSTHDTRNWNHGEAWPRAFGGQPSSRDRIIDEQWFQAKDTRISVLS